MSSSEVSIKATDEGGAIKAGQQHHRHHQVPGAGKGNSGEFFPVDNVF